MILTLSLYIVVVFNLHYWHYLYVHIPITNSHNLLLWLTMPFFMLAIMNLCLQLLFWPWLHKLVVPLLLLTGSAVSYAVMTQDIYFDSDMMQNILQTHWTETKSWITPFFLLWVGLTGLTPAIAYLYKIKIYYHHSRYQESARRFISIMASLLIPIIIILLAYSNYISFFRNNKPINHQISPINVIGSTAKTIYNEYDKNKPLQRIGLDAHRIAATSPRKQVFILVLGETTRAENWGLNGYSRQTTPQLASNNAVINFPQVSSCGTATAISVPCLFSNMPRQQYKANLAAHQESLMDILQRAQLYTSWRDNDGGCKGVCDRIKQINISAQAPKQECLGDGCWDMNLLTNLRQEIAQMPNDGIIVLHMIGSHGPAYYQRYPDTFRRFTPTCDTNQIQQCTAQQLRNTYDNTILYIDHFLAQTIQLLNSETNMDVALWYFSDHGESLGENGLYLHATPYMIAPSQQTHIPMIFWANASFYQDKHLNQHCLMQKAATQAFSHDHVFHSMLGIMNVATQEYDPKLDLFQSCR